MRFVCRYKSVFAVKTDLDFVVYSGTADDTVFGTGNMQDNFSINLFTDKEFNSPLMSNQEPIGLKNI